MIVDLRSDTVTRPTPEMYQAMQTAELGDDVLGDDPTVTKLEQTAAQRVGMEAGVFVPSGTMGNQIAIATHTKPGDSILVEEDAHVIYYEVGAPGVLASVVTRGIRSENGVMSPAEIERKILPDSIHHPPTSLLCLENTNNRSGGTVIPIEMHAAYQSIASQYGLKIHLDGARVFNAAVAMGVEASEICKHVDSVCFCLSKGLASPVGSVLCGTAEFIERARKWRKRLGGGMRQAGVLAACGLVSLEAMVERLAEDHAAANALAQDLAGLPGLSPSEPVTNILMIATEKPALEWQTELENVGVRCIAMDRHRLRLVFHKDVTEEGRLFAVTQFRKLAVAFA